MKKMIDSMKKRCGIVCAIAFFAIVFFLGVNNVSFADSVSPQGVVVADSLNVRTGPGTSYDQLKYNDKYVYLYKDDVVDILGEEGSFYKVQFVYNNVTFIGYSSKFYIQIKSEESVETSATATPTATALPSTTTSTNVVKDINSCTINGLKIDAKVTASALNVRTKASKTSPQVSYKDEDVALVKNTKVVITKQKIVKGVVWYYITFSYKGKKLKGYVLSDYVKMTLSTKVKGRVAVKNKLIVRKTAGISDDYVWFNDNVVQIPNNKAVVVKKETTANCKKWLLISFSYKSKTIKGYVLANKILLSRDVTFVSEEDTTSTTKDSTDKTVVDPTSAPTSTPTTVTGGGILGRVSTGEQTLRVRVKPGTDQKVLEYKGNQVKLADQHLVNILGQEDKDGTMWYHVNFDFEDTKLEGYVVASYVKCEE